MLPCLAVYFKAQLLHRGVGLSETFDPYLKIYSTKNTIIYFSQIGTLTAHVGTSVANKRVNVGCLRLSLFLAEAIISWVK